jgi:hypothetical protein
MPRASLSHAGERDFNISIEKLRDDLPASNFPVETWRQLFQTWAKREFVSMDEDTKLDQLSAHTVQMWSMPYCSDLDPDVHDVPKTRRIVHMDRIYDITKAEVMPRCDGREIVLTTLSKAGGS